MFLLGCVSLLLEEAAFSLLSNVKQGLYGTCEHIDIVTDQYRCDQSAVVYLDLSTFTSPIVIEIRLSLIVCRKIRVTLTQTTHTHTLIDGIAVRLQ
jgi:hypothetical protein